MEVTATPFTTDLVQRVLRFCAVKSESFTKKTVFQTIVEHIGRPLAKPEIRQVRKAYVDFRRASCRELAKREANQTLPRIMVDYSTLFERMERLTDRMGWLEKDMLESVMKRRLEGPQTVDPKALADLRSEERNYASIVREIKGYMSLARDLHKTLFDAQRTVKMQNRVLEFFRERHPELAKEFAEWLAEEGL